MSWDHKSIHAEQERLVALAMGGAAKEELLAEIVRLRAALYPLITTLAALDAPAPRGVNATSKLFPAPVGKKGDAGKVAVFDEARGAFAFLSLGSHELHLHEYVEAESLTVGNARPLHDDVAVIAVHGQWPGATAFLGEVTMRDVRRAARALAAPLYEEESIES